MSTPESLEAQKSRAVKEYFASVDRLHEARMSGVESEIAAAKQQERAAWEAVQKLIPDAFCR